jgi:CRP/FNR family cyclic AMP-dependent transcriptional regulator
MPIERHHPSPSGYFENLLKTAAPLPDAVATIRREDSPLNRGMCGRIVEVQKNQYIFSQGEVVNVAFYLEEGTVKLTVLSEGGREATIAMLSAGSFIGEECVMKVRPRHMTSAVAHTACTLIRIERAEMIRALHEESVFFAEFVGFLLARNAEMQGSLLDQIFNCSEKRLARALLQMAHLGPGGPGETVVPKVGQEVLAKMVGTTRSRVSHFMNRFRRLGYIEYSGTLSGGLCIRESLRTVVLGNRGFSGKAEGLRRDWAA